MLVNKIGMQGANPCPNFIAISRGDRMNRTEKYYEWLGQTVKVPTQCDSCKHYVYVNGYEILCTNPKYKGNQRFGASLTEDARPKCLYDDWEWSGHN